MVGRRGAILAIVLTLFASVLRPGLAMAHSVSKRDASFLQSNQGLRSGRSCTSARSTWSPDMTNCVFLMISPESTYDS